MRAGFLSVVVAGAVLGSACINSATSVDDDAASLDEPAAAASQEFTVAAEDLDTDSEGEVDETKGGETYPEYDARRDALSGDAGTSGSYGCTSDCSGHEAGAEWAEEHGITDPDDCGGTSWSFEEGCRDYASDQQEEEPDVTDDEEL